MTTALSNTLLKAESLESWCSRSGASYIPLSRSKTETLYLHPLLLVADKYKGLMIKRPAMFAGQVFDVAMIPPEGAVISRDFRLIGDGLIFQEGTPPISLGGLPRGFDPAGADLFSVLECAERVTRECVFFGGFANFGHFMFQAVLRLAVLNWLPELKRLPIAVYDNLPNTYYEFLDLLGYPAERRIPIPMTGPTRFSAAWMVSLPMYRASDGMAAIWPEAIWALRENLGHLLRPTPGPRSRIFIAREGVAWRRLVNKPEILARLERHGITPVALEKLSAIDQIRTIATAEINVSVLGAASGIMVFAAPDCAMIEMAPPHTVGTFGTVGYSAIVGQRYHRIEGRSVTAEETAAAGLPPNPTTVHINADFAVDVTALDAALDAALQRVGGA